MAVVAVVAVHGGVSGTGGSDRWWPLITAGSLGPQEWLGSADIATFVDLPPRMPSTHAPSMPPTCSPSVRPARISIHLLLGCPRMLLGCPRLLLACPHLLPPPPSCSDVSAWSYPTCCSSAYPASIAHSTLALSFVNFHPNIIPMPH